MNTQDSMPEELRALLDATPASTRAAYESRRRVGITVVAVLWGVVGGLGIVRGTVNPVQLVCWLLLAAAGVWAMRWLARRAELRLRMLAMLATFGAVALLIGQTAESRWEGLGASCVGLLLFLSIPALALLAWMWRGVPFAQRWEQRVGQAFGVALLAGVPLTSFCHVHNAPHLWLTHLAPAVLIAVTASAWLKPRE